MGCWLSYKRAPEFYPKNLHMTPGWTHTFNPSNEEAEKGKCLGSLASQSNLIGELQANERPRLKGNGQCS